VLDLGHPVLDELAVAAAGGAGAALLLALAAHVRVRRLRRGFAVLDKAGARQTVFDAVADGVNETRALRAEVAAARADLGAARNDFAGALRRVSVVRYDAFGDMGGRLSFTAALLDDAGDGLVLTSIHGRSEARTYAKGVKAGASEQTLSPEEQQAIQLAMHGPKRG
jgi:hypothetical protein